MLQRVILILLGVLILGAWGCFMGASMSANMWFGLSLGKTEAMSPQIIAAASVASDVVKAVAPLGLVFFLANRKWWLSFTALILIAITTIFSMTAAVGFSSQIRAAYSDDRIHQSLVSTNGTDELSQAKNERSFLPKARPAPVVEADIAKAEGAIQWKWSAGCTQLGNSTRAWCDTYRGLKVELAAAQQRAGLDLKIAGLTEKVDGTHLVSSSDPQAETFAKMLAIDRGTASLGLILLLACLFELGSTLGLTVGLGLIAPEATGAAELMRMTFRGNARHDPRNLARTLDTKAAEMRAAPAQTPAQAAQDMARALQAGQAVAGPLAEEAKPAKSKAKKTTPTPTSEATAQAASGATVVPSSGGEYQTVRVFTLRPPFTALEQRRKTA